jgi:hypothetical protein
MDWYWISLPSATFGLGVVAGIVRHTPPIAAWARGRDAKAVLTYYWKRDAWIAQLKPHPSEVAPIIRSGPGTRRAT